MRGKLKWELTEREAQVLRFISEGLTNEEIANEINISINTAQNHVSHILRKLSAKNRTHAAVKGVKQDLI